VKEVFTVITTMKLTCNNKQMMFFWIGFQLRKVNTLRYNYHDILICQSMVQKTVRPRHFPQLLDGKLP